MTDAASKSVTVRSGLNYYISGVADALNNIRNNNSCFSVPENTLMIHAANVVKTWFTNYPEYQRSGHNASGVVAAALTEAWPCKIR
ncbi:MAG: hypothetical protein HOC33_11395 [Alphaproteobacteria bacterium]|nr:hypothetical protein [Alphaproteobacteria bacterium]MBT4085597.1 hypothetical protein [Alphaproteobacteria bacterium]MBT4544444.1 hypothetical protein [Alphaproteobacteria bacterium]